MHPLSQLDLRGRQAEVLNAIEEPSIKDENTSNEDIQIIWTLLISWDCGNNWNNLLKTAEKFDKLRSFISSNDNKLILNSYECIKDNVIAILINNLTHIKTFYKNDDCSKNIKSISDILYQLNDLLSFLLNSFSQHVTNLNYETLNNFIKILEENKCIKSGSFQVVIQLLQNNFTEILDCIVDSIYSLINFYFFTIKNSCNLNRKDSAAKKLCKFGQPCLLGKLNRNSNFDTHEVWKMVREFRKTGFSSNGWEILPIESDVMFPFPENTINSILIESDVLEKAVLKNILLLIFSEIYVYCEFLSPFFNIDETESGLILRLYRPAMAEYLLTWISKNCNQYFNLAWCQETFEFNIKENDEFLDDIILQWKNIIQYIKSNSIKNHRYLAHISLYSCLISHLTHTTINIPSGLILKTSEQGLFYSIDTIFNVPGGELLSQMIEQLLQFI